MEKPKIVAFLGTGLMGFPMAKNILQQGHTVKAWNRSAGKAEPLAQFGGKVTASVQEAARVQILSSVCSQMAMPFKKF